MLSVRRTLLLLACAAGTNAHAQEYSYDGNRWYEVEVSVFTNEYTPTEHSEIAVPEKTNLLYLPRLQELLTRVSSFDIEFPEEKPPVVAPILDPNAPALPEVPPLPEQGPLNSPAVPGSFHIADSERDPFMDLGSRFTRFTAMNRSLDGSGEHRVLWHKAWRQPMQGRAQTQAVFLAGGNEVGNHHELEGSLRLSDGGVANIVMLDINVWLNRFSADVASADPAWQLPQRPFPLEPAVPEPVATEAVSTEEDAAAANPPPALSEVWQLEETREITANQLYYLDHPALGVLIQIRPYVLPPSLVPGPEEDF